MKYNADQIAQTMQAYCERSNKANRGTDYATIAQRYIDATCAELMLGIADDYHNPINSMEVIPIKKTRIRDAVVGQYTDSNGQRRRWYDWLHAQYPMFLELKTGYRNNQNYSFTEVKPLISIIDECIPNLLCTDSGEASYQQFESLVNDLTLENLGTPPDCDIVQINPVSLQNYIDNTALLISEIHGGKPSEYNVEKLIKYLTQAKRLLDYVRYLNQNWNMPQIKSNTVATDRIYYRGINLQTISKEVRHAALGNTYRYDLNTAMFAWKRQILAEAGIPAPAMDRLIRHKAGVRLQLSNAVFQNRRTRHLTQNFRIDLIKSAITALGFGATPQSRNGYGGIDDIIKNPEDRERFLRHEFTLDLVKEQQAFIALLEQTVPWSELRKQYAGQRVMKPKAYKLLDTHSYQNWEAALMNDLRDFLHTKGVRVLLQVHDCIYTDRRIPNLPDVHVWLRDRNPYLSISHEEVRGNWENRLHKLQDAEDKQHRRAVEEQQAQNYVGVFAQSDSNVGAEANEVSRTFNLIDIAVAHDIPMDDIRQDPQLGPYVTQWQLSRIVNRSIRDRELAQEFDV
jgi:hypothetical protein